MGQYDIYAMPNTTAEEGLLGLFNYVNEVSNGSFFGVFIGALWLILFIIGMRISSASRALTYSCFIMTILSIPLAILNLLSPTIMYAFIIGLAIGLFWLKQEE